ncbi:MAG: thiamine diphosphokinase [Clostridia bacterium]|nr:thiamine diphosphokinase [Clostridia bacterium]
MRAFIYTGGAIRPENIYEMPKEGDLIIAADGGLLNARKFGVKPQILLGDFDSLGEPDVDGEVELIRVPAEKDDTDTQLAVRVALERGARELVIVGGLEGRLDHTLSSLAILEDLDSKHLHAVFTSGQNRARFLRNNSTLIARGGFRYLSLIAADTKVRGVSVEGCKYSLKNAKLTRLYQYTVSNEITGNCALIDVRRGGVWIIETND